PPAPASAPPAPVIVVDPPAPGSVVVLAPLAPVLGLVVVVVGVSTTTSPPQAATVTTAAETVAKTKYLMVDATLDQGHRPAANSSRARGRPTLRLAVRGRSLLRRPAPEGRGGAEEERRWAIPRSTSPRTRTPASPTSRSTAPRPASTTRSR